MREREGQRGRKGERREREGEREREGRRERGREGRKERKEGGSYSHTSLDPLLGVPFRQRGWVRWEGRQRVVMVCGDV